MRPPLVYPPPLFRAGPLSRYLASDECLFPPIFMLGWQERGGAADKR